MATIGLSKPYFAKYTNSGNAVTYSEGGLLGKATEVDVTINVTDDNNLYADNSVAEAERSFVDGTLTLSTDDLDHAVSAAILGINPVSVGTINGVTDADVKELIFDDDQNIPYLGVGFVVKKKHNGAYKWRAIVLTKVMFAVPSDAATTQGENIEWQTPTLSGTIMRDDTAKHAWKREATFTTEAQAEAYIKNRLGIA